jgi:hypothetical protein
MYQGNKVNTKMQILNTKMQHLNTKMQHLNTNRILTNIQFKHKYNLNTNFQLSTECKFK